MKTFCSILIGIMVFMVTLCVFAGEFKVYPGAVLDERATEHAIEMAKEANMPSKVKVYTTNDAFDKVASFYKGMGKELDISGIKAADRQLAFILFDDASDLVSSKLWAKIQRPAKLLYREDVKKLKSRDITVIILVDKRE